MRPTKVVMIGAASASFGPAMIADAILTPEMRGSTLILVDLDADRLRVMTEYARRLNAAADAGLDIESETDRKRALPGAEFVITSVAVKRDDLWRLDFQIPIKHGIKQVLGENGGPGGLSHALRNIPIVLEIAADIEKICPNALLMNFSNPESRIGLALSRYTGLRFVGLCHGIGMGYNAIARLTGIPADDLEGVAAGLNHFTWFLSLRRKSTKEDVYPAIWAADATHDAKFHPLTRYLLRLHGFWPNCSDDHLGEYLAYAHEFCGLEGYDFERAAEHRRSAWERISRIVAGTDPAPVPSDRLATGSSAPTLGRSGELAFPIIVSAVENRHQMIEAVNIRNDGLIPNLPEWAIVEVPAVVGADGVKGVRVGPLPAGISALLNTQAHVQDLVVEAAVHGSRRLALQALLADPVVQSVEAAEKTLDELLAVHAAYLPRFAKATSQGRV